MARGAVEQRARFEIVDAIPHREIQVAVRFHPEHRVQPRQDLPRVAVVRGGKRRLAQHVDHRDRMHRGTGAVAGDVDEVNRQVAAVEESIAEGIAAQARAWHEHPVGVDRPGRERRGKQRLDVLPRLLEVAIQLLRFLHFLADAPLVLEDMRAQLQPRAHRERAAPGEPLAVDERAVRRLQVDHDDFIHREADAAVAARDALVREHDVRGLRTADHEWARTDRKAPALSLSLHHQQVMRAVGGVRVRRGHQDRFR